jgi:hypothetical protein
MTVKFAEEYELFERDEQEWIDKMKEQLAENLRVGKPLRYDWFREKKLKDKRLYYVINEKTHSAVLISFAPKKEQQNIIKHILRNMNDYLELIS